MLHARGARQRTTALRVDLGRRIRSVLFALRCAHSRSHILNPIRVRTVQCLTTSSGGALIQFVEHQSIQAEHRSVICSINRRSSAPTRTDPSIDFLANSIGSIGPPVCQLGSIWSVRRDQISEPHPMTAMFITRWFLLSIDAWNIADGLLSENSAEMR